MHKGLFTIGLIALVCGIGLFLLMSPNDSTGLKIAMPIVSALAVIMGSIGIIRSFIR
jgi:hypothetical protein